MDIINLLSFFATGASLIFAIWQAMNNHNVKKYTKTEAMESYKNTGLLLGYSQACLTQLRAGDVTGANQSAAMIEAASQALFQRAICNVHHSHDYSTQDVDSWVDRQKIDAHHKNAFLTYANK